MQNAAHFETSQEELKSSYEPQMNIGENLQRVSDTEQEAGARNERPEVENKDTDTEEVKKENNPTISEGAEILLVAAPRVDQAREFLIALCNPSTPANRRRAMLTEYSSHHRRPLPQCVGMLECTVQRDRSGVSKKLYPRYNLVLSADFAFLLAAQKMSMMGSAHYIITMGRTETTRKEPGYIGKLRSIKADAEYSLFGPGENPEKHLPPEQIRNEHAAIVYVRTVVKSVGGGKYGSERAAEDDDTDSQGKSGWQGQRMEAQEKGRPPVQKLPSRMHLKNHCIEQ
eukprot:TRINITY_DN9486_c0_g3_i1.p1 TRINITY_DN9486_c0_g3~~TRINITY_DN9486_c0_g3_i1.p1  ORF type:complete len:285 (+),score=37.98 TRINITY_DN9486_c0_g3_i1:655-1509(+)